MGLRNKPGWEPLKSIDQNRLCAWLAKRGLSEKEIARRVGIPAQTLNQLKQGKVKRCRRDVLRRLARVLGVSVSYLSGDPNAPLPGLDDLWLGPLLEGDEMRPLVCNVSPREPKTRIEVEAFALAANLGKVFFPPIEVSSAEASTFPRVKQSDTVKKWSPPGKNRIIGSYFAFDLQQLYSLITGGEEVALKSPKDADEFAANMALVIDMLLEPWTSGRLSTPPKGVRLLSALASVATGVVLAAAKSEEATLERTTEELERIAAILNTQHYGNSYGNFFGQPPVEEDTQPQSETRELLTEKAKSHRKRKIS